MLTTIKSWAYQTAHRIAGVFAAELSVGERCLIIAPHPDDETLGCGATIARAVAEGKEVRVVVVTDGCMSGYLIGSATSVAEWRHSEAVKACQALGVDEKNVFFLEYVNRQASAHVEALARDLTEQCQQFNPTQVFSPHPLDKHPDHRAVAQAVEIMCKSGVIRCPVYEYLIWCTVRILPEIVKGIRFRKVGAKDFLETKEKAMVEHKSQYAVAEEDANADTLRQTFWSRYFNDIELFIEKKR